MSACFLESFHVSDKGRGLDDTRSARPDGGWASLDILADLLNLRPHVALADDIALLRCVIEEDRRGAQSGTGSTRSRRRSICSTRRSRLFSLRLIAARSVWKRATPSYRVLTRVT